MAVSLLARRSDDSLRGIPTKEEFLYSTHFCEENVYMMAKKILEVCPEKLPFFYTVFISNEKTYVPLWKQSVSSREDGLVVWDYHVIMLYCIDDKAWVFDFDTKLPFPTEFSEYCKETFKDDERLSPSCHRFFRVIPAEKFLKNFSSDRRHMRDHNGSWKKPPPPYPVIRNSEMAHNLPLYISMVDDRSATDRFGMVFNLRSFVERFSRRQNPILDYDGEINVCEPAWLKKKNKGLKQLWTEIMENISKARKRNRTMKLVMACKPQI